MFALSYPIAIKISEYMSNRMLDKTKVVIHCISFMPTNSKDVFLCECIAGIGRIDKVIHYQEVKRASYRKLNHPKKGISRYWPSEMNDFTLKLVQFISKRIYFNYQNAIRLIRRKFLFLGTYLTTRQTDRQTDGRINCKLYVIVS